MKLSVLKISILLLVSQFIFFACDTEDPFAFPEPDFSTVPEPFTYSEVESVEIEEGVEAFILDEGEGDASVVSRDRITAFITLRTLDDEEIIYSSSANNNQNPVSLTIGDIQLVRQLIQYPNVIELSYTTGLKAGLIGMKEGERRTLIVSPEKGFAEVSESSTNYAHRNDTLQYDIVLSRILLD